ncbi:MAG: hypothetical protein GYB64_08075 [Chloroflexi bacterium]|nr:hypothetical protein [Chloroflexota bacterium]
MHERLCEIIAGESVALRPNAYTAALSAEILFRMTLYLRVHRLPGWVLGQMSGFLIGDELYMPHVAFIGGDLPPDRLGSHPTPPALAVEVDFPATTTSRQWINIKLETYQAVGTQVWVVTPQARKIEDHVPGEPVHIASDILTGGPALPGFTLTLADLFL